MCVHVRRLPDTPHFVCPQTLGLVAGLMADQDVSDRVGDQETRGSTRWSSTLKWRQTLRGTLRWIVMSGGRYDPLPVLRSSESVSQCVQAGMQRAMRKYVDIFQSWRGLEELDEMREETWVRLAFL